jgi:hypothetical protein
MPSVAPSDARVLGRAYDKQVDVTIARWDRGPELLISTKTMVSAFGKNLGNRFEEAYGDAGNLRSRYPLAAVGYFFVQRSTILQSEPGAFERTKDMMRKLRELDGTNGYTATGLALVSWDDDDLAGGVTVELDAVPDDIGPAQFFARMIERVVEVTPVVITSRSDLGWKVVRFRWRLQTLLRRSSLMRKSTRKRSAHRRR